MHRPFLLAALLFAVPAHAVVIDWVKIGDPGNDPDYNGYGSVPYSYRISKYEITNAQYAEFLNAVATADPYDLYSVHMAEAYGGITRSGSPGRYAYSAIVGRDDMPVTYVSFYNALRFANWLHNGQPVGAQGGSTTEDGAYTITHDGIDANSITRNAGATILLPSEDEWYKAAYYDAATASYNPYPFADGSNRAACEPPAGTTSHSANCNPLGGDRDLTHVGAYAGSPSEHTTFDQGGNALEWNEAIIGSSRGARGGGFNDSAFFLAASTRGVVDPTYEYFELGFRVAMIRICDDGLDNDADGLADYPLDPGCAGFDDLSENSPLLLCDDGADNDGDGTVDFDPVTFANPGDEFTPPSGSGDPGCKNPTWFSEESRCQNGIDDDGDGMMDYDAGLSRNGVADPGGPDPTCLNPYDNRESPCGLGVELALLLPPLMWVWRRRRGG